MICMPFFLFYAQLCVFSAFLQVLCPFNWALTLIWTHFESTQWYPHLICTWSKERKMTLWPEMTMVRPWWLSQSMGCWQLRTFSFSPDYVPKKTRVCLFEGISGYEQQENTNPKSHISHYIWDFSWSKEDLKDDFGNCTLEGWKMIKEPPSLLSFLFSLLEIWFIWFGCSLV